MDELELLKKDWKKQGDHYPKLTYDEIYAMILKKSSSIVKWIFIISLLEFVFWIFISFLLKSNDFLNDVRNEEMESALVPLSVAAYGILLYFFYRFYKNYQNISTTDNVKNLMSNILKTRRTVKHYVIFNLATLVIGVVYGVFYTLKHDPNASLEIKQAMADGEIFKFYAALVGLTLFALIIVIGLLLVFYWLVYGILLKRLNGNYIELKKLEV